MAKIFYEAVKDGRKTIDEVPSMWRAKVERMLENDRLKQVDDTRAD